MLLIFAAVKKKRPTQWGPLSQQQKSAKERSMPTARLLRARSANLHQVPLMIHYDPLWHECFMNWHINITKKRELVDGDGWWCPEILLEDFQRLKQVDRGLQRRWEGWWDLFFGCFRTFDVSITIQWHHDVANGVASWCPHSMIQEMIACIVRYLGCGPLSVKMANED